LSLQAVSILVNSTEVPVQIGSAMTYPHSSNFLANTGIVRKFISSKGDG